MIKWVLLIVQFALRLKAVFIRRKKFITKNTVLFLPAFFHENSGYHWRVKKWADLLVQEGYQVTILPATTKEEFYGLRRTKYTLFLIKYMRRRFKHVLLARKYETVIVRRELLLFNDYGNLFLEKLLLRIHPNAILDFDDDIAAAKSQPKKITNWYARLMGEHGNKFNVSLRMYKRFIVASNYLKERVLQENPNINPNNIAVIPTCVDYDKYPLKNYPEKVEQIAFGWIGGDHNYNQLRQIIPVLNKLSKNHSFKLIVIGGSVFESDAEFEVEFIPWSLETEVESLYKIDVGLMPLEESNTTKGKGGFKLIQYMGLGIVSVASAVTINKEIVSDGENSFLVYGDDWEAVLNRVFEQKDNYSTIGKSAKIKIKNNYSFSGNTMKYVNFIEQTKEI